MKIWEVELKEKNPPASVNNNHMKAPVIDTIQVHAPSSKEAVEKALKLCGFEAFATKVELIAETQGG